MLLTLCWNSSNLYVLSKKINDGTSRGRSKCQRESCHRLEATSLDQSKDILEMSGRKAVPLRALIVKGESNLSNLGGTACVYSLALVNDKGEFFLYFAVNKTAKKYTNVQVSKHVAFLLKLEDRSIGVD